MTAKLLRTFPAKRGECGLVVIAPFEGLEVVVRVWREGPSAPWRVLPNQSDGVTITTLGRIRVEELLNS